MEEANACTLAIQLAGYASLAAASLPRYGNGPKEPQREREKSQSDVLFLSYKLLAHVVICALQTSDHSISENHHGRAGSNMRDA